MEVVPGMFPLERLALLGAHEIDEKSSGVGMLSMNRDAHVQLDSGGDLLDRRVAQRRTPFLVSQGVILATIKHHHRKLPATDPIDVATSSKAADVPSEPLGVSLHVVVTQQVLGGKLSQSHPKWGGHDLALPLGLEYVFHAGGDVLTFHEVGVVGDSDNARGDHDGHTFWRDPIDARVGWRRAL